MDVHIRQCNEQSTPPLFVQTNPSSQLQSASKPFHIQNVFPQKNNNRGRWELQFSVRTDNNIKKKYQSISILHWCVSGYTVCLQSSHTDSMTTHGLLFWGPGTSCWHPTPFTESSSYILAVLAHLLIDLFSCLSYSFYHNSQIINL